MSVFRTQLATEESRVLFVGSYPQLLSGISHLFSQHEIAVIPLSYEEFLKLDVKSLDGDSVYKIVWWVDFSQISIQQEVTENLRLSQFKQIVVAGILPEKFMLEGENLPPETDIQQQFFNTLPRYLPNAQFFFTRDFLDGETLASPLEFAFRGHTQQSLLDPEIPWYLSTVEGFLHVISSSLIRPHTPKKAIIQGKPIVSSTWLKKIARLYAGYYSVSFEVTPVIAYRHSPILDGFIGVSFSAKTADALDACIRNKNTWISLIPSLSISPKKIVQQLALVDTPLPPLNTQIPSPPIQRVIEGKRLVNRDKNNIYVDREEKIEGELARIFHKKRDEKKEKRIDSKVKIAKKIAKKSQKNKTLFIGGVLAMIVGGVILSLWGMFFISTIFVRRDVSAFFDLHTPETVREYTESTWSRFLASQVVLYDQFLSDEWLGEGKELIQLEEAFQNLLLQKKRLSLLSAHYFLGVLGRGDSSAVFPQEIKNQHVQIQETMYTLSRLTDRFFRSGSPSAEAWMQSMAMEQQDTAVISQLSEIFPSIMGEDGKRTYAVLLQNDLELRPTGGFIQAIALLVFDRGLLIDSQVIPVHELDAQITGTVQPPAEISQHLGEEQWRLRDSNWDPDFPSTAQRAAWFIREATGIQVDGVWAIQYRFIQESLRATGPLEIPEYSEILTEKNVLERVEMRASEDGVSPGTRNYASLVLTYFLRHLQTASLEQVEVLLSVFRENLEKKQILMSFFDVEQEEIMSRIGWNGRIIDPACPQEFLEGDCIVDQVFQVETNIGQNRVGSYISREVAHRVDLSGEKVLHTRNVTLKNTSRSTTWPLGSYKTYVRFIVDDEIELSRLTINGRAATENEMTVYGEGGRRVVGITLDVPPQSSVSLELSYTTEMVPKGPFSFLLFDQKQPGVSVLPTTITLYNPHKRAALIAPAGEMHGDRVEFKLLHDDHLFTGVHFQ